MGPAPTSRRPSVRALALGVLGAAVLLAGLVPRVALGEPTLWGEHSGTMLVASVVFLSLAALVVGLIAERRGRLRAEAESHERLRELSFMNRRAALGELSASIAHDINQPLGAILNNAEAAEILLTLDPPRLDEVGAAVRSIRDDGVRAGEIVRRMRSLLSRGELERRPVDVRRLVNDTAALLRSDLLTQGIESGIEVFGSPKVAGDATHLQQLLLNVSLNAMEAMRFAKARARTLTVSALDDERGVVIRVSDTGRGFSAEALDRAFEPFFTTKGDATGMGMGLAIARRIVDAHHGTISVANNVPRPGATVTIVLPRHDGA